jgi:hypothetical protein
MTRYTTLRIVGAELTVSHFMVRHGNLSPVTDGHLPSIRNRNRGKNGKAYLQVYKFSSLTEPPAGILDFTVDGKRAGSTSLLAEINQRIKPQLHLFGHIHEGHGVCRVGERTFVNASICNPNYLPIHSPLILESF